MGAHGRGAEGVPVGDGPRSKERIEREEIAVGDAFWERYVFGPESTDDPEEYGTELNRVLDA